MNDLDDFTLIQTYLQGDPEAFNIIYERYKKPLYGYLNNLFQGSNNSATDDIFQQTWLKAIQSMNRYRNQEKFSAWLMRIAHNLTVDYYRAASRRAEDILDNDREKQLVSPDSAGPRENLDQLELSEALDTAIQKLSPELREVFLLRQQDFSFREIAEIQQCSINTCLARMQYAMKKLRSLLQNWMPGAKVKGR